MRTFHTKTPESTFIVPTVTTHIQNTAVVFPFLRETNQILNFTRIKSVSLHANQVFFFFYKTLKKKKRKRRARKKKKESFRQTSERGGEEIC